MISRGVVVWLGIAIVTGICLFLVKYQVRQLEERLLALNERVVANQDATHILKAEWANLNDIGRIDQLSVKFLKLQPMSTAQLGTVDSLPMRRSRWAVRRASSSARCGSVASMARAATNSHSARIW